MTLSRKQLVAAHGYLTVVEAADLLKMRVSAIYKMLDSKRISEMRIGRSRYVLKASLIAYLQASDPKALIVLGIAKP